MQNKGIIKFFIAILSLVSIYSLFFTWKAKQIENKAVDFSIEMVAKDSSLVGGTKQYALKKFERYYLDSIADQKVIDVKIGSWEILSYTYRDVKNNELNLGLDLKGGISVILEISVSDILKNLANNTNNPIFNQAILDADKAQSSGSRENYVDLFYKAFEKIAQEQNSTIKLSSSEIFGTSSLRSQITPDMSNAQSIEIVKKECEGAIDRAYEILRSRIDKFGVSQPMIQRLPGTDQIMVELAGISDAERVRKMLQSSAALEFWKVYTSNEVINFFVEANQVVKEIESANKTAKESAEKQEEKFLDETDSLKALAEQMLGKTDSIEFKRENPLFAVLTPVQGSISEVAYAAVKDTATVNLYLSSPKVQALLSKNGIPYAKFLWANKPSTENNKIIALYAIESNRNDTPALGGDVIENANETFDEKSRPAVSMQMNPQGAAIWARLTEASINKCIAIVLDNEVYSAPQVQNAITGGQSQISGNFTIKETKDLANILKAGKLPAKTKIIQSEIVGPSLGQESIEAGMISFILAFAIIFIWMIFYYSKTGLFADVALIFNILFIFGILASMGFTLTLPGIAGIVLTLGMSVDANVIIYERIKEELKNGKSAKDAIRDGYKNARSSIFDANLTTFFTAVILYIFGKGPIQGFALTLMIGIITSLLCAMLITRLLVEWDLKRGHKLHIVPKIVKNWYQNLSFDFVNKRKMFYIISISALVISIVGLFTRGLDQGIDFVGGRTYTIRFEKAVKTSQVAEILGEKLLIEGKKSLPEVKTFGTDNQVKIVTKYKAGETGAAVDDHVDKLVFDALKPLYSNNFTFEEFTSGEGLGIMESNVVGPTIANDIKISTFWALFLSLGIIFLYILIRFKYWQYSVGAIASLFHDVIIVLGIFALLHGIVPFSLQIDQSFIAAILTVIGYSLNDTVIIFDRIREEVKDHSKMALEESVNLSINKTISRTINTSLTTLLTLVTIFIFGGETIRGFMFAMIIGVVVGTYSSIFIATPITVDLLHKKHKRDNKK